MHLRLGVVFKALTRLAKEIRRHRQITLGGRHIDVTEIGRQLRQQSLNICTLPVLGDEAVNSH